MWTIVAATTTSITSSGNRRRRISGRLSSRSRPTVSGPGGPTFGAPSTNGTIDSAASPMATATSTGLIGSLGMTRVRSMRRTVAPADRRSIRPEDDPDRYPGIARAGGDGPRGRSGFGPWMDDIANRRPQAPGAGEPPGPPPTTERQTTRCAPSPDGIPSPSSCPSPTAPAPRSSRCHCCRPRVSASSISSCRAPRRSSSSRRSRWRPPRSSRRRSPTAAPGCASCAGACSTSGCTLSGMRSGCSSCRRRRWPS